MTINPKPNESEFKNNSGTRANIVTNASIL